MRISDWSSDVCSSALVELHLLAVLEVNHQADLAAPPALARQQALQALQRAGRREVDVEPLGGARGGVVERLQRLRGEPRLVALALLGGDPQQQGLAALQQVAALAEALREQRHLVAAGGVGELDDGHAMALAVVDLALAGDDAGPGIEARSDERRVGKG